MKAPLHLLLLAAFFFSACSAPLSFHVVESKTPHGNYTESPLDAALRELEEGKKTSDPMVASTHFIESARLAGEKALAGEKGAVALYNHAIGRLVEDLDKAGSLPWGRHITTGSDQLGWKLAGKLEPGAPAGERHYVPVDSLDFKGKYSHTKATRPGVGAPLVAISTDDPNFRKTFGVHRTYTALTAILRFGSGKSVTLELHDPLEEERLSIAGRNPPLAADFSSPGSLLLATDRTYRLGIIRLLNPQKYSATARLSRLQKYDAGRTPVLFVHGLQDTPATWMPMYESLLQDAEIRKHYQFWVFSYPSGYPYPYSASLLRKELDGVAKAFPGHKRIVIVGHSMGGIISRLMVTDAGDKIWRGVFGKGPDEMKINGSSRRLLLDSYVFEHRPDIQRAIFISAPHRGSALAEKWFGRLGSRLVRMPSFLADARNAVASVLTADNASIHLQRTPNSIDTLSPDNPFVREVNKLPIAPGIPYHSIMGDRGKGGNKDHTPPVSSDGVVPYWSSHMDGAVSEKIVPSHHSAHQHPDGIAEVKRILKKYAEK
ncbi:esterase/lipase family protein [Luteolibacter luteus]|uniref:Alpha/beta fold hydrolase n=1 Tax=Luteolibacter luteus TaxID=2728835 RepID=A0A858RCY1_9BACT|nr:alpha/beta fold hydrolase [Luteolibacter luteus]QJE94545.1 alpha/beta fold hydrolase [Luteolibacter luteus]